MEQIKLKEKEVNRIEKIIRIDNYNPISIFELTVPFNEKDLRKKYFTIIRLIHPDKNVSNNRFNKIFNIVNENYKILSDRTSKDICIKSLRLKKKDILKQLKQTNINIPNVKIDETNERQIVLFNPMVLSTHVIKNNIQKNKYKINSTIAINGAEHTKNKSKSKSDKHQKGLKQRKVQKNNAENRIINHKFSFTNNISIEEIID